MFADTQIHELNLSTLNTAKVTSMKGMFSGCSLSDFDGSKFNTQNVTDMSYMFADSKISYCNFWNFNTENVTDMSYMFRNLHDLYRLDLIFFNTSRVSNMEEMFYNCYGLNIIYVDEDCWSTSSVTNSTNMFYECSYLEGGKGTKYDDEHCDAEYARVDKAGQPGYLTAKAPSAYAALSNENTVLTFYYDNKKDKRGGMSIGPFKNYDTASWYSHRETLREVVFDSSFAQYKSLTSTRNWFWNCKITSITDIENLNTEKVTDIHQMFYNCSVLESIDLSHFSTTSVVDMSGMFGYCLSLTSLDVNGFDTSNVTDMSDMFNNCTSLRSLDLNTFKTDKVSKMNYMFNNCTALQTIYNDNTWTCSQSNKMFKGCTSLKGAIEYDASKIDVTYANPETGYFTPTAVALQCAKPVIHFANGELSFTCDTEDVEFVYDVTQSGGAVSGTGNSIQLTPKVTISVYAKKDGFTDSETATQEICISSGENGDVDGDGEVTIADAVRIVNVIIGKTE
jgi:surface protein